MHNAKARYSLTVLKLQLVSQSGKIPEFRYLKPDISRWSYLNSLSVSCWARHQPRCEHVTKIELLNTKHDVNCDWTCFSVVSRKNEAWTLIPFENLRRYNGTKQLRSTLKQSICLENVHEVLEKSLNLCLQRQWPPWVYYCACAVLGSLNPFSSPQLCLSCQAPWVTCCVCTLIYPPPQFPASLHLAAPIVIASATKWEISCVYCVPFALLIIDFIQFVRNWTRISHPLYDTANVALISHELEYMWRVLIAYCYLNIKLIVSAQSSAD